MTSSGWSFSSKQLVLLAILVLYSSLCFFFWEFHKWAIVSLQRSSKGNRHSLQIIYGTLEWISPFYTHSFPNPELTYFGQLESMQNSCCLKETFDFRLLRFEDPKAKNMSKKFETISRHFQAVSPPWMELNKPKFLRYSTDGKYLMNF